MREFNDRFYVYQEDEYWIIEVYDEDDNPKGEVCCLDFEAVLEALGDVVLDREIKNKPPEVDFTEN